MAAGVQDGSFVWTMFPFGPPDHPDRPGPVRHVAYVVATDSASRVPVVLLAYTRSGIWRGAAEAPSRGVIEFDAEAARRLGQRPSHLDLRCLAQVPLTIAWFPDLGHRGNGVVGLAGGRLRNRIDALLHEMVTRDRALIEMRGPRTRCHVTPA